MSKAALKPVLKKVLIVGLSKKEILGPFSLRVKKDFSLGTELLETTEHPFYVYQTKTLHKSIC